MWEQKQLDAFVLFNFLPKVQYNHFCPNFVALKKDKLPYCSSIASLIFWGGQKLKKSYHFFITIVFTQLVVASIIKEVYFVPQF